MSRTLLAVLPITLLAIACSATPDASDSQSESTEEALKKVNVEDVDPDLPPKKKKDPPGLACGLKNPGCSYTPANADLNWLSPEDDAERISYGCDPAFRYTNGAGAGFLGGIFSRCPDTAATRARFPTGYGSKYCDKCLPPAGNGKIYVLWLGFVGPNCPSGCKIGPPPEY